MTTPQRDEIWERGDGSHWRILATDGPVKNAPLIAVSVKAGSFCDAFMLNHWADDGFVRQVREPREFTIVMDKNDVPVGAFHGFWPDGCPDKFRGRTDYVLVREVLNDRPT